MTPSVIGWFLD